MNKPLQYSHEDLDRVNTDFHQGLVEAAETLASYPVHWWTKETEEKYKLEKTLYKLLEQDYHNRPTCTK
eukprot:5928696-Ditylum_brightwellii.AAC.1